MPANLPPEYFEEEKKLRTAKTIPEKIEILERLLSIVPKHKGTEKLQAVLKRKISKLREQQQRKSATARRGPVFYIEKSGAGQVILIGPPNSGKSQILNSLTNAYSEVADYPYSTKKPVPGMMPFKDIKIQLIDTPPIGEEYLEPWLPELVKIADAVLLIVDLSNDDLLSQIDIVFQKLKEKKIQLVGSLKEKIEESFFIKKTMIIGNKFDLQHAKENFEVLSELFGKEFLIIPYSAKEQINIEELKEKIYNFLDLIRVYSKIPGKKPDLDEPFVFKKGSTIMDMAEKIHKDFAKNLKYARVWNKNNLNGLKVTKDYILQEEDIVELHI
ncbi:50S ribosome-binding GTPase [Candidatus Aminicenantes bacterium AC-335-K20]|jgi:hypothetical protein|nr:50S ribosome-binding GTPase [SCandidatus Aminicenantes bacterium Aminicenantia_JdfR_composite]MCP2597242.1 50S ribosome-binding GTPase [Candidatus Aminicenantes bacterium AC-335-G13]MCP2605963.1 50S ribosome-binding GTPase [Candidatus Aminicenantes bacterium AC-708-I09]MCP2618302.1 50S ribosome-binding GTPase [Candidatus Aminicenantes bacterium AC-335-A11]MCP2619291.1 50S ribosome-binding GTPase [Candidatus Aminicenantes bacterium AC-335-K20]MCP2620407.1 50S ribosome-binding GTPase [Candida